MDWKNVTGLNRGIFVSYSESRNHQEATSNAMSFRNIMSKDKKDIYAPIS
jgi:ribosomal protein L35AE/L33A